MPITEFFSSFQSGDTFTSTTEYFSADEGAFSADEFFDLPQDDVDEEAVANNASDSDKILELFRDVDDKLEGSGDEQEEALRILREREEEVRKPTAFPLWCQYEWLLMRIMSQVALSCK